MPEQDGTAITAQGRRVAEHWSKHVVTYAAALQALRDAGVDPEAAGPEDLHGIDMIHMGGLQATDALAEQAGIAPGQRVLDVGAGLAGSSRRFADCHGAQVTAVELSEVLADTARRLTALVGLSGRVEVLTGSALALPVPDASAEVVVMQHVAMQIAEKDRLFGELSRVLAPGGRLALHEIFAGTGALHWPLPWATDPGMSALEGLPAAVERMQALGLVPGEFIDESEAGRQFHEKVIAHWGPAAEAGEPRAGLSAEVLQARVAASRAMEHNLRVGALKVGRILAVKPG